MTFFDDHLVADAVATFAAEHGAVSLADLFAIKEAAASVRIDNAEDAQTVVLGELIPEWDR